MPNTRQSKRPDNVHEWLPALGAVHLISNQMGGDASAKRAIIERLKDGAIYARASWMAHAIDIGEPYYPATLTIEWEEGELPPDLDAIDWKAKLRFASMPKLSSSEYGPGKAFLANRDVSLGPAFFSSLTNKDISRWCWATGFILKSYAPGTMRFVNCPFADQDRIPVRSFALGVEFAKSDILAILSDPIRGAVALGADRGAPPKQVSREFVKELFLFDRDSDGIELMTANSVVDAVNSRLSETLGMEYARSSAHPLVQTIQQGLRGSSA